MVILRFQFVEQLISAVAQNIVVAMTAVSEENRRNGVEDEHVPEERRQAAFVSVCALVVPNGEEHVVTGQWEWVDAY